MKINEVKRVLAGSEITYKINLPASSVFERLGQGASIGYRRNAGGAGVWIVRLADGKRGKIEKRLALAGDIESAEAGARWITSKRSSGRGCPPTEPR